MHVEFPAITHCRRRNRGGGVGGGGRGGLGHPNLGHYEYKVCGMYIRHSPVIVIFLWVMRAQDQSNGIIM